MTKERGSIASPRALLIILALINFLNYVDRFVISALIPFLEDPVKGLGLDGAQIGRLQTAFMIVHSVASVPLGYLADRWLRKRLISAGVGLWSVATAAAAFATTYAQLFVARAAVGIGEATYAPAASALISDRFPVAMRARAMGIFQLGMVLGGAVGIVVGGVVASRWGWRAAFLVVGLPGLVLAVLALLIREAPVATRREKAPVDVPSSSLRVEPSAASWASMAWITVAGIFITFFTGAITFWAPTFILRSLYGGDAAQMGTVVTTFGPLTVLASIAGVLSGSAIADRLERVRPGTGRLTTIAAGVVFSAPCAAVAFLTTTAWMQYLMLALGVFFNVWYVGPILAALHDVVPPRLRATATGAYFLLIHLLGDAISPWVVGEIDVATGSLKTGLLVATGVLTLGAFASLFAMPGSRHVAKLKRAAGENRIDR
jgi:MFS transporter, Spinster family, sphingosine-1-phosphate transporter